MSTSTLAEVLDLPFALVTVFMAVIRALVTAPFRHRGTRRSPRSLYLYLVYSALRCLVIRISPKQCQMVMPSSHFTHQFVGMLAGQRRLAKAAAQGGSVKAEADTAVVLPHNATGHWVGAPEAEVVVMWFHGGGYVLPSTPGHVLFYHRLRSFLALARPSLGDHSLALFVPAYSLAPGAPYPTQLRQATGALAYLLAGGGKLSGKPRPPSSIILAGDSAGANLACGLLSHLVRPHPALNPFPPALLQPTSSGRTFRGLALISPWCEVSLCINPDAEAPDPAAATSADDAVDSKDWSGDLIVPAVGPAWGRPFLNGAPVDGWNDPMVAAADRESAMDDSVVTVSEADLEEGRCGGWAAEWPVSRIFLSAGGNEVLRFGIARLAKRLEVLFPHRTEFCIAPGEAHDAAIYNILFGSLALTEQERALRGWLVDVLPYKVLPDGYVEQGASFYK